MASSTREIHENASLASRAADVLVQQYSFSDVRILTAFLLTVTMVLVNSADFQGANAMSFSINFQIYLRLLVCGALGLFGILNLGSCFRIYSTYPGFLVALYGVIVLLSVPTSIALSYSAVTAICLWTMLLFLPAALELLTKSQFILALATGAVGYVLTSWVFYLAIPEIGIWKEYITIDYFLSRMGGLGHPNTLGFYVSSALLMLMLLARKGVVHYRVVLVAAVLWVITIYCCLSRTPIILTILGTYGIFMDKISFSKLLPKILLVISILFFSLLIPAGKGELDSFISKFLRSISKSGNTSELTSLTGRSDIWAYAIERSQERPLTGFGYGTPRFVMINHSFHCHNIIINGLLSCGLIAGILLAYFFLILLFRLLNNPDPFQRAFTPVYLVGGMVESMIYSPAPSLEMLMFFTLILWKSDSTKTDSQSTAIAHIPSESDELDLE